MQDSLFMSLQFSNFRHVGKLPNGYLIPTESMRGNNLILQLYPLQRLIIFFIEGIRQSYLPHLCVIKI